MSTYDDSHAGATAESGEDCGGCCGGGASAVGAPVLSDDPRLDVLQIPHERRHATILEAVGAVGVGGALVLVAPHAPRPVLAEIDARYPGAFTTEWLQSGPEAWQIRLRRQPALG